MARRVKHEFSRYDATQQCLISIGQMTHSATSKMTIWSAGYKVRSIAPLSKEDAMTRGADLVGEAFLFGVGGGLVIWEYNKSKEKELQKEESRHNEIIQESERLQKQLNQLSARLVALEDFVKTSDREMKEKKELCEDDRGNDNDYKKTVVDENRRWLWLRR